MIIMSKTNAAADTDLKVIDPVRKEFSNGVERLAGSGEIDCFTPV
ncbi:MAG: hypothetical protein V1762_04995 [Nitrospirota bacterium]